MIGTIEQMIETMENGVKNFAKDGECSRCGACCTALLPMSSKELKELKRYVKKHHIKPKIHVPPVSEPMIDMTCPFFDEQNRVCAVYERRPGICRSFVCSSSEETISKGKEELMRKYPVVNLREVKWEVT